MRLQKKIVVFALLSEYQLKIAPGLGMEACVLTFLALGPHLTCTFAGSVHAASFCEFICVKVLLCLEDTATLVLSIPCDS